jgi:putative membrane protein
LNLRSYRTFQALILAALGFYMLAKVNDGRILLYINQRFVFLVLLAALGLIALAQVALRERPAPGSPGVEEGLSGHSHGGQSAGRAGWMLWLLALPVLIGLLIPERPLGASALEKRGINTASGLTVRPASSALSAAQIPPAQRSVLDWIRLSNQESLVTGEMADVVGFVYHDARLGEDQFLVGRFSIACCVADAVAVGMIVAWPEAANLPDNRWVRVRGPVQAVEWNGSDLPMIAAQQVEVIPEPEQPYLFP